MRKPQNYNNSKTQKILNNIKKLKSMNIHIFLLIFLFITHSAYTTPQIRDRKHVFCNIFVSFYLSIFLSLYLVSMYVPSDCM